MHYTVCPLNIIAVVQLLIHIQPFATPWTTARQASLSFTVSWSLFKLMSIVSVMPSNHLVFCRPLLLLPSIFPNIRVFSNELVLHIRWPKYWSFLPVNIQDRFSLGRTGWISLQCSLLHLNSGSCLMPLKVVTLTIKDVFRGEICKR